MTDPTSHRRHFYPTPTWLIYGLLVVEGLLWLSERYQWFGFNEKKGWTVLIGVAVVGGAMVVMLGWFLVALVCRWRFQFAFVHSAGAGHCRGSPMRLAGGGDEEG